MKNLAQTITANSILLLTLGFLSTAFYYNLFDIPISNYLEISEISIISIPSFQVMYHTFLIFLIPLVFLKLTNFIIRYRSNKTKSTLIILESHIVQHQHHFKKACSIIILMIIAEGFSAIQSIIAIIRIIISIIFGTKEFYLHPSSRLGEITQNLLIIFGLIMTVILYRIALGQSNFTTPIRTKSLNKYLFPIFLMLAFLVNIYYLYAKACRIYAQNSFQQFSIQTNFRLTPFTSKQFILIGATKNYLFLKSDSGITTIKADRVLLKLEKLQKNVDSFDSMDAWKIPIYSIFPPSL